jgi:helicase
LYKIPYILIDTVEKLDTAHDGFISLDEFWIFVDSRSSSSTKNRITSNILLRSRKRDLTYCLLPDEDIMTNVEVKKISEIKMGDYVLTHTGTFKKVLQLHKRKYEGDVYKITPRRLCLGVNLTANHKIFTENGKKRVDELTYQDKLIYPIIKKTKDVDFLKISDFHKEKINKTIKGMTSELIGLDYEEIKRELVKKGWSKRLSIKLGWYIKERAKKKGKVYGWRLYGDKWFYSRFDSECNDIVKINNDFMEFAGYFLSDGSCEKNGGDVTIAFGLKEYEYAKRTQELFKIVFGANARLSKRNGYNIYTVRCVSMPICNFLKQLFGEDSHSKHVPEWFLTLPKEKQKVFVDAYIVGDGNISKKRNCVQIVTVSKHITFALIQMLLRNDIYASCHTHRAGAYGNNNKKLKHLVYTIIYYLSNKNRVGEIKEDKLILPIKKISKRKYKGLVYNIGVEKDHSYTTFSFVTKNCFTSQMLDLLDKRVRKILDFTAYTILNPTESVGKTLIFRGGYPKSEMILKTMRFYAHGVFQLYNTNQEINMIEDDGQPPKIIFQESPKHPPKYFDDWGSADKFAEKYWSKNLDLLSLLMAGQ